MNKKSKLLITLLPIMALCFVLCTNVSYADVRVNITEEKTDKLANPRINSACQKAIELYMTI